MKIIEKTNPLLCDPETGICEVPATALAGENIPADKKPVQILYFTDPICSSCWGIEPQLRKLKLEYGNYFDIDYKMGGLLKGWDVYGGSDVSNPTDVASHWDEASAYYGMPIDGDLWLEDPLPSSYPPSIAFKAAQLQGHEKGLNFLRRIKEMIFLEKKNITRWEHLQQAALETGLDVQTFKADFEGQAVQLFEKDLELARELGVRGFPTLFFTDADDNRFKVYGSKPYENYEQALLKLYPEAVKQPVDTAYEKIFSHYPTLTLKEFAVLTGSQEEAAERLLSELTYQGKLDKYNSKNGALWRLK
ncbi:ClpXP adapter SpxH family protein [Adhaeribacter radiodurans]|uniref:DsbA family protein n=1 Tax=Adhaeribacter radiodurans TaxID=2745197 RepID=A0A7L7L5R7_9BACT|nr:ClpXP adapter SpxH family protein [Adhaeribacter radiodurans]QMU28162.1 DsbA family protein [Adhaeribacter radiodurans]